MRKTPIFLLALSFVVGLGSAWADPLSRLSVTAEFSIPVNPPAIEDGETLPPGAADTVSVGVGYRFWGIFTGSVHLYNEIIYGAANPVGVTIRPMGLFSGGFGLEIPLGGPDLIFDSQWLFTDRAQQLTEYQPILDDPNARFSTIGIGTSLRF